MEAAGPERKRQLHGVRPVEDLSFRETGKDVRDWKEEPFVNAVIRPGLRQIGHLLFLQPSKVDGSFQRTQQSSYPLDQGTFPGSVGSDDGGHRAPRKSERWWTAGRRSYPKVRLLRMLDGRDHSVSITGYGRMAQNTAIHRSAETLALTPSRIHTLQEREENRFLFMIERIARRQFVDDKMKIYRNISSLNSS